MVIKSTMGLYSGFCPICKLWGQLKYRKRYHQIYAEFDHYTTLKGRISKLHHNYKSSCYIGNIENLKVQELLKLKPQPIAIEVKTK